MKILGVFNGIDANATLSVDGQIVGAIQEERMTREKFIAAWPARCIEVLLARAGLRAEDIDLVTCGAWSHPDRATLDDYFGRVRDGYAAEVAAERMFWSLKQDARFREDFYRNAIQQFPNAKLSLYDHHYSHAAAAFYASPHEKATVITADGRGDGQSLVIWDASRDEGITRRFTVSELHSLGMMYSQVTSFLGFKPHRHEGKITGLAAYGKTSPAVARFREIFGVRDGDFAETYRKDLGFKPFMSTDSGWLAQLEIHDRELLSYAAQEMLEEAMVAIVDHHVPAGSPLCLAGGSFANVKLNQRIRERTECGPLYVFPAMGDGGIGFGACLAANVEHEVATTFQVPDMYLGQEVTWEDGVLDGLVVRKMDHDELVETTVGELIEGRVVGIVTGRMEFGPRALGARSILITTADPDINKRVNARLNRSEFMPFAPVTLRSQAARMYLGWTDEDVPPQFMTACYDCTDAMKAMSPAVVHVDGTARPQIIDPDSAPKLYFDILNNYFRRTDIPSLVNTSFNNHEEPIVCSGADVIDSLRKGNVDVVVTDGMMISLPAD